jgi:hypothetical protein
VAVVGVVVCFVVAVVVELVVVHGHADGVCDDADEDEVVKAFILYQVDGSYSRAVPVIELAH